MASQFPPWKDADLFAMATESSALITAGAASYGLTSSQATALAGLVTTYTDLYNAVQNATTRTTPKVAAKNEAKKALVQNLRDLNRYVQANKTISDEKKLEIKFPVYAIPAPRPAPTVSPTIVVVSSANHEVKLRLLDAETARRGKPKDASIAYIYAYLGATPPTDIALWSFQGTTSKADVSVSFSPTTPAGAQVWFSACWLNARQQPGPMGSPITTNIAGGVSGAGETTMKIAA
ncbi:hypothetical protein BH09PLA1_BH09PLA1_36410 [soil metagenome]